MINLYGEGEEEEELRQRMKKRFKAITAEGKECFFSFFSDYSNWKDGNLAELDEAQAKLLRSLPIFPVYTSASSIEFSSITDKMYLPPTSADVKFLNESFFKVSKDIEILDNLGVKTLNDLEFYSSYVCPQLSNFSLEEIELSVGKFLEHFPKYLQEVGSEEKDVWVTKFSNMAFMLNQQDGMVRPADLYDPGILSPSIQEVLDEAMLPKKQLCTRYPNTLSSLRLLGIKSKLSPDGIIEAAKRIEAQKLGHGRKAKKRGMALLNFLDSDEVLNEIFREIGDNDIGIDKIKVQASTHESIELLEDDEKEEGSNNSFIYDSNSKVGMYFDQLVKIAWLPVENQKGSDTTLRPPTKISSSSYVLLAAPESSRPKTDEWLCSASMDIVSSNIRSDLLIACLGWNHPISVNVLCTQLLSLSKAYSAHAKPSYYQQQLATTIPRLYASLTEQIKSNAENEELVTSMLSNQSEPCVWVGNAFMSSKHIAFEAPENVRPYLVCKQT